MHRRHSGDGQAHAADRVAEQAPEIRDAQIVPAEGDAGEVLQLNARSSVHVGSAELTCLVGSLHPRNVPRSISSSITTTRPLLGSTRSSWFETTLATHT
jgi:hypothetical protein